MPRPGKAKTIRPSPARPGTRRTRAAAQTGPHPTASADDTTRGKILATALRVFAERGFEGARTRDIAEQAGANLGLITYYFDNKETLWREAVTSAFAELERELAEATAAHAGDDARRQLEQLARRFVRFVARRPEFMRLMNDEGKQDSARMRWLVDRFVRPMHESLRALIEAGQARGFLPKEVSVESLHYILLGAAGLVFSQAPECLRITGVDPTTDAFAEAHADALIRIFTGTGPATTAGRGR
jgi:AcrR family transcriptional regulator